MSIDTTTRDTQYEEQVEKLEAAIENIDDVASENAVIEPFLRDVNAALDDAVACVEREGGDLTPEEFAEEVYPSGGRR